MASSTAGRILLGAVGLCALACSGEVLTPVESGAGTTRGYVVFERVRSADPSASAPDADSAPEAGRSALGVRSTASASFLRLSLAADEQLAARLVGAGLTLPEPGRCARLDPSRDEGLKLASLGPVDLVDVGEISVETGDTRITLAARAFPDLVDLISGVVYATRDNTGPLAPDGSYRIRISGSASLPPTILTATAPEALGDVTVGGRAIDGAPIALRRGDLPLTWRPAGEDPVYVDLSSSDSGTFERQRCAFYDTGSAVIKAEDLTRGSVNSLTLHRVRRQPITMAALEGGEIRFDEAVAAALRFETEVK